MKIFKKLFAVFLCFIFILSLQILPFSDLKIEKNLYAKTFGWENLAQFSFELTTINVSSYNNNYIIVGTNGNGVFLTTDGKNFKKLTSKLDALNTVTILFYENNKTIFIGTDGNGLFVSKDTGNTWETVSNLECTNISKLYKDPYYEDNIFVASFCTGLHLSKDSGKTWLNLNNGINTNLTSDVLKIDKNILIVSTLGQGIFKSTDDGKNFYRTKIPQTSIRKIFLEEKTGTIYAINDTQVYISYDKGENWSQIPSQELKPASIFAFPDKKIVVGTRGKGILISKDTPLSFKSLSSGISSRFIKDFYFENGFLYFISSEGEVGKIDTTKPYLYISSDEINFQDVYEDKTYETRISVENLLQGTLSGNFENIPSFLSISKKSFQGNFHDIIIKLNPKNLENKMYQIVLKVNTNGGISYLLIKFNVLGLSPVEITLKVDNTMAIVNGKPYILDAAPFIDKQSGRTLVPIRFISESFGCDVSYNILTKKVTIKKEASKTKGAVLIELWIGKKDALVNGNPVQLDTAPTIKNNRTFVPLRFISETFGAEIFWDAVEREIKIVYKP